MSDDTRRDTQVIRGEKLEIQLCAQALIGCRQEGGAEVLSDHSMLCQVHS